MDVQRSLSLSASDGLGAAFLALYRTLSSTSLRRKPRRQAQALCRHPAEYFYGTNQQISLDHSGGERDRNRLQAPYRLLPGRTDRLALGDIQLSGRQGDPSYLAV